MLIAVMSARARVTKEDEENRRHERHADEGSVLDDRVRRHLDEGTAVVIGDDVHSRRQDIGFAGCSRPWRGSPRASAPSRRRTA